MMSKMSTFYSLIGHLLMFGMVLIGAATAQATNPDTQPSITVNKLPFCDEEIGKVRDVSDRLLYVTTLDGRLSALDLMDNGLLRWSVATGPGPLLSSSIHRLELTNNGKWVRMIPSLSGGLYKFDGDTIEPVPFNAEDLLKSSFKFSDDLVISGGKETRSYGVSTRTGQVIYECTMHGCRNATELIDEDRIKNGPPREGMEAILDHDSLQDDMIVIRRQTQTVRAVESRTGSERWNFSIGHHELDILKSEDCRGGSKELLDSAILDLELKVVIPEGLICAVSKSAPNTILWKYKFEHPIVSAWRAKDKNELMSINLFKGAEWLWNEQTVQIDTDLVAMLNPSLYLGMHQRQLYIQESTALMVQSSNAQKILLSDNERIPTIPWKPFMARPRAVGLLTDENRKKDSEYAESTAIARSVLYQSNYVDGDGFFLFTPEDLNRKDNELLCSNDSKTPSENSRNDSPIFDFSMDPDAPVKIIIISIWFWWKEILLISATTAFVLNVVLRYKNEVVVFVERKVEVPVPIAVEATEEQFAPLAQIRSSTRSLSESSSENFTSRFQEDFELVQCLGKGGFGVVFEVRNKLDDCHYAIKRVVLPYKQESKDRVMREVKTLAHCEHNNIVRYFHAWTETPPPGWQESRDKIWMERNCLSTSIDIETPTETSPPNSKIIPTTKKGGIPKTGPEKYNIPKHSAGQQQPWLTKLPEQSFSMSNNDADRSSSCSFIGFRADPRKSFRSDTEDDSFQIEFKHDDDDDDDDNDNEKPDASAGGDSIDIVFQDPSNNTSNKEHIISITETSTTSQKPIPIANRTLRKNRHRRPLSLDLTSAGRVNRTPAVTSTAGNHIDSVATSSGSFKIYLYIQMQLCRKQSLKEWLALNDLAARQDKIIPIFEQIVDAVEYVHLKGLIHRDLKPSNIFFSLDGRVKIGDFGLVTDSGDVQYDKENNLPEMTNNRHTRQVGTQLYMSPEQLKGLPYDYKVDIYSLGLILFELLVSFGTEMERIYTLKDVRKNKFPDGFEEEYSNEYELLKLMLADQPKKRLTTFGIKARPPLKRIHTSKSSPQFQTVPLLENSLQLNTTNGSAMPPEPSENNEWHFELPPRRKDSRSYSTTGSSSSGSNQNNTFF
ncbi:eukaryotic translation initiation factor 2-alpha kinase [Toxorhynchites rutilus septentrionalis]|uniref:eukaryotic translation initiation factor 2-alpha kinase n=1 Tax=Toxorhynchites rutilus septentrionalis TaxID=329112 RepID=UPI002479C3C7|nr:eukaryotic translation initiation factor 2-alpha kinase [Toxorhynchites rutilus septentrionalis]